jgi:toxin-antitoxin system PIN domain toxin|tara:strand:- start:53415 stop:53864 length:450 start_codon:yes stop_codon:yes gene_type:complete
MRYLLDINLVIALMDPDHVFHQKAHDWWSKNGKPWASCPLTENGFVRITSSSAYSPSPSPSPSHTATVLEMTSRFADFARNSDHEFWPDDFSITDRSLFDHNLVLSSKYLTDLYLLKLASRNGGCLATFDRNIPIGAIRQDATEALLIL